MSDPGNQEKHAEFDDLDITKETVQDLSQSEAEGVKGGNFARTVGACANMNLPTGVHCPHVTDTCASIDGDASDFVAKG